MKVSRNDSCPCGSGKKYKKCCLESVNAPALGTYRYDADVNPDPVLWISTRKEERWQAIERYHVESSACFGDDVGFHAFMHSLVEEMLMSEQMPSVGAAFARLRTEGIQRHQAIHALAYRLRNLISKLSEGAELTQDDSDAAIQEIDQMTAASWLMEKLANKCSDPDHKSCGHGVFDDEAAFPGHKLSLARIRGA